MYQYDLGGPPLNPPHILVEASQVKHMSRVVGVCVEGALSLVVCCVFVKQLTKDLDLVVLQRLSASLVATHVYLPACSSVALRICSVRPPVGEHALLIHGVPSHLVLYCIVSYDLLE